MKKEFGPRKKKIKITFDLDGVIIDKPPLIPKRLLEWFFRGGKKNGLNYHFPTLKLEQWIRKLSHFYLLRPAIKSNIEELKKLDKSGKYELYAISARYSFLGKETETWLKKRKLTGLFKKIILNFNNEQPHLFKERKLKEIKPVFFVEDDGLIADYLVEKVVGTKIFCLLDKGEVCSRARPMKSLKELPLK